MQANKAKKIDYAQCIRFEYNSNNFDSDNFLKSISEFSNIYMTETYLKKDQSNYTNQKNLNKLLPNLKKQQDYIKVEKYATKLYKNKINQGNDCMAFNEKKCTNRYKW